MVSFFIYPVCSLSFLDMYFKIKFGKFFYFFMYIFLLQSFWIPVTCYLFHVIQFGYYFLILLPLYFGLDSFYYFVLKFIDLYSGNVLYVSTLT